MQEKQLKKVKELNKEDWKPLEEVAEFKNSLKGKWVQQGPYIINTGSSLDYGIFVGMELILVGVDETGQPVLKSRYK